jgi:hypothetical protein
MMKFETTSEGSVIVKEQVPVPLQLEAEPLPLTQPAKVEPLPAAALRRTTVFSAKFTLQVPLLLAPFQTQLIPLPVTVPLPVPLGLTVSL